VSFRAWTQAEAEARGLSGWVRNEADGSVRALFHGEEHAVAAMIAALHDGPPSARVDDVVSAPASVPQSSGFYISG